MTSSLSLYTLFPLLFTLSLCAPALVKKVVFVPPVLYPNENTTWTTGSTHNVTWNVSSIPTNITNPTGVIFLANNGLLNINDPLGSGFNILLGRYEVVVPNVEPGCDYQVVVMGDSGNYGKKFCIQY